MSQDSQKREIVVPDPNDRIVHQKLYEFLKSEKQRRDNLESEEKNNNEQDRKIEDDMKEIVAYQNK